MSLRVPLRFIIASNNETVTGHHFHLYRDKIGNIRFAIWRPDQTLFEHQLTRTEDLKKLRAWLDKIIQYRERK